MAETSGFFLANLVDGTYDRRYYARDFAAYFAKFIGNGIFADSKMLAVSQDAVPGMSVLVASGDAYINGYWYNNSESIDLALATADASLPRYDMVVLRLDMSARSMNLAVKTGTPASVPSVPSLSRASDLYELGLAKIYIAAGTTKIVSSNITDLRLDNNYCGTVTGVVNQIDTTEYGSQLNNFIADYMSTANNTYEEFKASLQTLIDEFSTNAEQQLQDEESEFTIWFNDLKGKLGNDPATSLQTQVDEINNKIKLKELTADTILEWALSAENGDKVYTTSIISDGACSVDGGNLVYTTYVFNDSRLVCAESYSSLDILGQGYGITRCRRIVGSTWYDSSWRRDMATLGDVQNLQTQVADLSSRVSKEEGRIILAEVSTELQQNYTLVKDVVLEAGKYFVAVSVKYFMDDCDSAYTAIDIRQTKLGTNPYTKFIATDAHKTISSMNCANAHAVVNFEEEANLQIYTNINGTGTFRANTSYATFFVMKLD